MTSNDLQSSTGVSKIRKVSTGTTVIEFSNGGVRPASSLELSLWDLLTRLTGE
jgi:hypothetical protein